ncbi:MAG TPA: hypothetical protein DHW39_04540 [Erysipelotrichaceae bacterium]|nr:hypothetical protein [Erysipelotrichaceae bacterium]
MTKLLVQGDDYGFTKAVTLGIVEGIDNGILRNTGLFANMPSAEFAVSFMKDRPQVCFGIDFNIVSGPSVSDPKDIPHLVDENGEFIRSGVRVKDPMFRTEEGRRAMFPFEETYREIRAQYDRFVELTGKKPGYLHGHSLSHEHYMEAIRRVSEETGVPYSADIKKKYGFRSQFDLMHFDMEKMDPSKMKKEFDPLPQFKKNTIQQVMDIAEYLLGGEYAEIGGHPGYVDGELMDLTTLSIERPRDLQMMTSDVIKQWVRDNNIELITYYDLY